MRLLALLSLALVASASAFTAPPAPDAPKQLIPAVFSPTGTDGVANVTAVPAYADYLSKAGVTGVFVCGSTGEGVSHSVAERKELLEAWIKAAAAQSPPLRVIAMIGALSLVDVRELIQHADSVGADSACMFPPMYYKAATAEILGDAVAGIAALAPTLPLYYYHIPSITGVGDSLHGSFTMTSLAPYVAKIPNFAGFKFSYQDLLDLDRLTQYGLANDGSGAPRFEVLFGKDELALSGLTATQGRIAGFVGSTYNFAGVTKPFLEMLDGYSKGSIADANTAMTRVTQFVACLLPDGFLGVNFFKAYMNVLVPSIGEPRWPMEAATPQQVKDLLALLKKNDFPVTR